MSIKPNDPRLTAYALGELDADEAAAVEAALVDSEELRRAVREIQETAESVSAALRVETAPSLSAPHIERIEKAAAARRKGPQIGWVAAGLAAAASVLLAVFLGSRLETPKPENPGPTAQPAKQTTLASTLETPPVEPQNEPEERPVPTIDPDIAGKPTPEPSRQPVAAPTQRKSPSPPSPEFLKKVDKTLAGKVTDEAGYPVPGAQIRVWNPKEQKVFDSISGSDGSFEMKGLPSGPVKLQASLTGFRKHTEELELNNETTFVNPVLHLGAVQEVVVTVPVQGGPLQGRVPVGMLRLVPGVSETEFDETPAPWREPFNTEAYDRIEDNSFRRAALHPLSTFSIDVDTASYSNVRRFLSRGSMPPKDAVRIEELLNYFRYDYPPPTGDHPFSVNIEVADAPWDLSRRLVRIGLKGREIQPDRRPAGNFVFLLDVSGSMQPSNKLPLLKRAMRLLIEKLTENDRVAIVVYAGASGLALPSTPGDQKEKILDALSRLQAGGSTNGGAGIQLAYDVAAAHFIEGGVNRVILATDGDFNVGTTNQGDLTRLIEQKAKSGVFLSVLGFGMDNYKDSTLEKLADKGNGNYGYIDTFSEARKLLVEQMEGTLVTIAKDVKIQVEFNPALVEAYRLIGYENRALAPEDFNDDRKDAGEIGAGHTVTALYEVVPASGEVDAGSVDPLKYQSPDRNFVVPSGELLTVKLRYKEPTGDASRLLEVPVTDDGGTFAQASNDFKFAAAVAGFGMLLRDSQHKGGLNYEMVLHLVQEGMVEDPRGYRSELLDLANAARRIAAAK